MAIVRFDYDFIEADVIGFSFLSLMLHVTVTVRFLLCIQNDEKREKERV